MTLDGDGDGEGDGLTRRDLIAGAVVLRVNAAPRGLCWALAAGTDALDRFAMHTSSAIFAYPPGALSGGFVRELLLG
jgi:hypothetical protein